jgi:hypothetical protein
MGDGPPEPVFRDRFQTTLRCCGQKVVVVSGNEKARQLMEPPADEPKRIGFQPEN